MVIGIHPYSVENRGIIRIVIHNVFHNDWG